MSWLIQILELVKGLQRHPLQPDIPEARHIPAAGQIQGLPAFRESPRAGSVERLPAQVPTRSGARSLRRQAITDNAVIIPVFGFSDGIFSIDIENRAESASTSTRCVLRVTLGSAQISSVVRSGPIPASDSATATFRLAGNPLAASRAVPSNTFSGSVRPSMSMLCSTI